MYTYYWTITAFTASGNTLKQLEWRDPFFARLSDTIASSESLSEALTLDGDASYAAGPLDELDLAPLRELVSEHPEFTLNVLGFPADAPSDAEYGYWVGAAGVEPIREDTMPSWAGDAASRMLAHDVREAFRAATGHLKAIVDVVLSRTSTEMTHLPFWTIIDGGRHAGVWFSREAAEAYLAEHHYNYGSEAYVYGASGHESVAGGIGELLVLAEAARTDLARIEATTQVAGEVAR